VVAYVKNGVKNIRTPGALLECSRWRSTAAHGAWLRSWPLGLVRCTVGFAACVLNGGVPWAPRRSTTAVWFMATPTAPQLTWVDRTVHQTQNHAEQVAPGFEGHRSAGRTGRDRHPRAETPQDRMFAADGLRTLEGIFSWPGRVESLHGPPTGRSRVRPSDSSSCLGAGHRDPWQRGIAAKGRGRGQRRQGQAWGGAVEAGR
jgi:hypothetical protein